MKLVRSIGTLIALGALATTVGTERGAHAADPRSYTTIARSLELQGAGAGWVNSADVSNPSFLTMSFAGGLSKAFYSWITASLAAPTKTSGAIVARNNGAEIGRTTFSNAVISSIGFPALDAASKDAANMSIVIAPESTNDVTGAGATISTTPSTVRWLPANFAIAIDGLDCSKVSKVSALTTTMATPPPVTVRATPTSPAVVRAAQYLVTTTNVTLTVAQSSAAAIYAWQTASATAPTKKNGAIRYLAPDMTTELFRTTLTGLGIVSVTALPFDARVDTIRRVAIEMSIGSIAFAATGAVTAMNDAAPADPFLRPAQLAPPAFAALR